MSEYELVEFVEPAFAEGGSFAGTLERVLGVYDAEADAIAAGRSAFYRSDNGTVSFYDFAAEDYRELKVSPNIISLKAHKGAGKVISDIPSATLVDLGDGGACLEFHTKMNAINGEIVDFMANGLDFVDANGAGMVIGNSMTGASLATERLAAEFHERREEIETALSLGSSVKVAAEPAVSSAFRAALIPSINAMAAMGLVFLPGMMTGQILSGTEPLIAVKYQIAIMCVITGSVALTAFMILRFGYRSYFTSYQSLREH